MTDDKEWVDAGCPTMATALAEIRKTKQELDFWKKHTENWREWSEKLLAIRGKSAECVAYNGNVLHDEPARYEINKLLAAAEEKAQWLSDWEIRATAAEAEVERLRAELDAALVAKTRKVMECGVLTGKLHLAERARDQWHKDFCAKSEEQADGMDREATLRAELAEVRKQQSGNTTNASVQEIFESNSYVEQDWTPYVLRKACVENNKRVVYFKIPGEWRPFCLVPGDTLNLKIKLGEE